MTKQTLRFYWNGIKGVSGILQKVTYSKGHYTPESGLCENTITIYKRDHTPFSAEVRAWFTIQNDSDGMTDYFETDRIRVSPDHPLYQQVNQAFEAREAHYEKRFA